MMIKEHSAQLCNGIDKGRRDISSMLEEYEVRYAKESNTAELQGNGPLARHLRGRSIAYSEAIALLQEATISAVCGEPHNE